MKLVDERKPNRYEQIIERIFCSHYKKDDVRVVFTREDIVIVANELGITLPKNLGDVVYSFRYRNALPETIIKCAPQGKEWIILPAGRALYEFVATPQSIIIPNELLSRIKIPDATPGVIDMYSLSDEQALLAKLRYNRLIDTFIGITCYSLQNHLRTTVPDMGQVETDEIYVGLDSHGAHYILPVQAKGGRDRLSIVQIAQDFAMCNNKFSSLICRPIAAQFMASDVIALFEFRRDEDGITVCAEKHYRLVPSEEITPEDLAVYRTGS
jgi:hypothetical protein